MAPAWPSFQHDKLHTGRSPFTGPTAPKLKWTYRTAGGEPGSPAVAADGTIYVASGLERTTQPKTLDAINPNGTRKWRKSLPGAPAATAPAIGLDGTVYVHVNGAEAKNTAVEKLVAFDPAGTLKWTFKFNNGQPVDTMTVMSSPAIAGSGAILVGSQDGRLYRLKPDGTVACSVSLFASAPRGPRTETYYPHLTSSPAIGQNGAVYVVRASTQRLFAYTDACKLKWSFPLPGLFATSQSPAVGPDGTVYVGTSNNALYGVRPTGVERCHYTTGFFIYSTPAIGADGTVYVGSDGLYALTPDCGFKWQFASSTLFSTASPIVDHAGRIYWRASFDAYGVKPDGAQQWSFSVTPGQTALDQTAALGADGTLYVADGQGTTTRVRAYTQGP